jgi:hypothetical protein
MKFLNNKNVELYGSGGKVLESTSTGVSVTGSIAVSSTVDGRDVATDGTKLDLFTTPAGATSGYFLTTNGTTASWSEVDSLPSQSGNNGKFLTTNGSAASWAEVDSIDLTLDQSWTGAQRGTIVTNNDNSFDLTAGNNFKCTVPSAGLTNVTFTGISAASGQSGYIILVNAGYTITLTTSTTDVDDEFLTSVSGETGTFLISYLCDGTVVYLINSKALS